MKDNNASSKRKCHADHVVIAIGTLAFLLFVGNEISNHLSNAYRINALSRMLQAIAVCVICYCGAYLHYKRTKSHDRIRHTFYLFFALYLYLLLTLTLMDETLGRGPESIYRLLSQGARKDYISYFVNIVPFRSIYRVYIVGFLRGYIHFSIIALNLIGNIIAFMPLAFFLPLLFKSARKWQVFLLLSVGLVVAVELLQFLLMVGSCDIDDLLLNAGGAILMFFILRIPAIKKFLNKFLCHAWEW